MQKNSKLDKRNQGTFRFRGYQNPPSHKKETLVDIVPARPALSSIVDHRDQHGVEDLATTLPVTTNRHTSLI
jgi:hypothetical protein